MKISRQGIYQALESPATRLQKAISYVLLIVILLSILALVVEERLPNVSEEFAGLLIALDYVILVVFGVEYITRLAVTPKPWRYAVSKEGVIDVLALLPSAVSLFVPALWNISWLRALRLLRFLRVLKLAVNGGAKLVHPGGAKLVHLTLGRNEAGIAVGKCHDEKMRPILDAGDDRIRLAKVRLSMARRM